MLFAKLRRLFATKPVNKEPLSQEASKFMVELADDEAEAMEVEAELQGNEQPYVVISPIVPFGRAPSSGWCGGAPRLPVGVAWPEIDGEPARFVCQLDLSVLPQGIWSGIGPRSGWLALFLHPVHSLRASLLHFHELGPPRPGPGQSDAEWARSYYSGHTSVKDHSPEWPVEITVHVGPLPEPLTWQPPYYLNPREVDAVDLADPGFHPFNEATLVALLGAIQGDFDRALRLIKALELKPLRDEDRIQLDKFAKLTVDATDRFHALSSALQPFTTAFDMEAARPQLSELARLHAPEIAYKADDHHKRPVLGFYDRRLCEKGDKTLVRSWHRGYLEPLYRHAVHAYTEDPSRLPPPQRARFEADWAVTAEHEIGAMGHIPAGLVHTPFGPDSPNEVLLELRSSDLVGWLWGDLYTAILLIDREDLREGRFDRVRCEITN